jgi:hypothetical protein
VPSRPKIALAVVALALTGLAFRPQAAQQQPAAYWYLSYYQVDFPKVDSLARLVRTYTLPVVEEQKKLGALLDYRFLVHRHGGRDNVVIMRKVASWATIERDTTFQVAFRKVFPDSLKRREINAALQWAFAGGLHRDEIFSEVTR